MGGGGGEVGGVVEGSRGIAISELTCAVVEAVAKTSSSAGDDALLRTVIHSTDGVAEALDRLSAKTCGGRPLPGGVPAVLLAGGLTRRLRRSALPRAHERVGGAGRRERRRRGAVVDGHDHGRGEGMVVKPLGFVAQHNERLVQPGVKCRGRDYLRLIYGPTYTLELDRLRQRNLRVKRELAVREFALGVEGLRRFVAGEPLRRVHDCAFGVLALEGEGVDVRL